MNRDALKLFPLPVSLEREQIDGSLLRWPAVCRSCRDRPCEDASVSEALQTCPYGINFVRYNRELLIGGVVVRDLSHSTPAHRKRAKMERESLLRTEDLRRALGSLRGLEASADKATKENKVRVQDQYLATAASRQEIAAELRPVIEQGLHQAHDYMLLLHQIQANAATILEERFPGVPPETAADQLPNEGAIFFAAQLMLAKIDATVYLREPNRINTPAEQFSIFKLVDKYARIYRSFARQRDVRLNLEGECYALVTYPASAIGAVVHTVLDNMVKYAPPKSLCLVRFVEDRDYVRLTYSSMGPQIRADERQRIFLPGYQADAARLVAGGGMGFGLAAAKIISDTLQLDLRVRQEPKAASNSPGYFQTYFSLRVEKTGSERGGSTSKGRKGHRRQNR